MINYAGRRNEPLSDQISMLWWRAMVTVTRAAYRLKAWALPIVLPLRPFWWIPPLALFFGFVFGLTAVLLLA